MKLNITNLNTGPINPKTRYLHELLNISTERADELNRQVIDILTKSRGRPIVYLEEYGEISALCDNPEELVLAIELKNAFYTRK